MNPSKKAGVLLVNLGTPEAPTPSKVRPYLRQFLSDPRVLDIPSPLRWLLLNTVILPFRPAKSAEAYASIWTDRGSPLLFHTEDLATKVRSLLGDEVPVVVGMRYGTPSIASAVEELLRQRVTHLALMLLFPHYASSSYGSALEEFCRCVSVRWNTPSFSVVPPFYDDEGLVGAFASRARGMMQDFRPDHVVFSYHGLPERHLTKGDECGSWCLKRDDSCCASMVPENRHCYRAQCFETTRLLAAALGIPAEQLTISFQSRLGRDPWIKPYTDEVFTALARQGKKRLMVFCPAFVADCLETLEEIQMRGREDFIAAGGEDLRMVPSLNSGDDWAAAVVRLLRPHLAV